MLAFISDQMIMQDRSNTNTLELLTSNITSQFQFVNLHVWLLHVELCLFKLKLLRVHYHQVFPYPLKSFKNTCVRDKPK